MTRILGALVCVSSALAAAPPFTIDQALSAAFPTEMTAAPAGGKVAWVSNARGVRNVMVAEPPAYRARKITAYTEDDGQEISTPVWVPDGSAVIYTRVDGANGAGEYPNPALNPQGSEQDIWIAPLDGTAPRRIGEGRSPAVSPRGDRVAFVRRGQLWWAPLDGATPPAPVFKARGSCGQPVWSPDGARLAFVSQRGDHAFIGIYEPGTQVLRYLDPSTDADGSPEWSPDSRTVAFIRIPSTGKREVREARRSGTPWSIRVAAADTGAGREIWRAKEGPGSVFRGVSTRNQLLWAEGGRIVFPWEADGWTHLYVVSAAGGSATLLTPGAFEVEHVELSFDRREVFYSSNQDDIDRRHLWKVAVSGGAPMALTSGTGLEWEPTPTSDANVVAFLRSDVRQPAHPAVRIGTTFRDLDPDAIPTGFPSDKMVAPQQVTFNAADGVALHGQLFLPPAGIRSGRAPAVVFFHGGSQRQMLLGWHYMYYYSNTYALNQYLANAGYVVLAVNYRSGTGYGLDFREALHYGPSGASEYNDVQAAGAYLKSRPEVDAARIGAWGGSYGGYLTALALSRSSDVFRAGVDIHGIHNWATELGIPQGEPDYKTAFDSSPLASVDTWNSPVLLIHGDDDRNVQFNQTVLLVDALRRRKVQFETLIFPDEVHDFLLYRDWRKAFEAAADFLNRHFAMAH